MRYFVKIGFYLVAGMCLAPNAPGATLNAGDILEIRFGTTAPVCPSGPCDSLIVNWNEAGSFFATNGVTKLFDGTTLLGVYSNSICCIGYFRSSSSLFQAGSTTVDFTAIGSGAINGIVDLSIGTGYLTWPALPTPYLTLGHATGPGFVLGGTGVEINSITILSSPEPSSIILMAGGLAFLFCRIGLRASRHSPNSPGFGSVIL